MIELSKYIIEVLAKDKEFNLYRGRSRGDNSRILVLSPVAEYPAPETLKRLEHEYSLREELDPAWAARPLAIARHWDRTVLVLEDPGGVPLDQMLGQSLERSHALAPRGDLAFSLRLAVGLSSAIERLHRSGIIHKDIKPANVLANSTTGQCWLKGFGIASRLLRERQSAEPPELVAGTLAYMAPEQTGRMNRSIDSRSDLYALGVLLYEMLTGSLPFTASNPMEWVHCHIARKPVPPAERSRRVPALISAIVMKLLAKPAEERYQTAAGAKNDLLRCLAEWETQGRVEEFPLGEHDTPDRLLIPEKLYGRKRAIGSLLGSFDRVVASGRPELVLVSGYSGIGKSSVVNELNKVLVPPRGLFASGKFDQYKRDIPYATLAQAFQNLIRPLLGKSEAELRNWREALDEALGPNGPLIVNLVPELKLILGRQPPVPELAPQDARRRFQLVFRRFINVFARPEHPLTLFLDDLQWLDAASLDLLEDLSTRSDVQHLMLIGAYRDNEVSPTHPLMRKLEAIRQAGAIVQEIILAPLTSEDLGRLIADSLRCEPEQVAPLAQLVYEKTGGNPFFAIQFLSALAEEALLTFDHSQGGWSWDLRSIQAKGYTDNVVNLMVGKLNRLPVETQRTLKEFACLGNSADVTTLSIVHGASEDEVQSDLWEALRLEFIVCLEGSYKFVHDRIQEAAYSLIPEELRAEAHLRIGRLLIARTPPERREEAIFEIVNQLNRGATLISSRDEREQLAELNLMAGKRARASTAYTSALNYLIAGAGLLPSDGWTRRYDLAFALELYRAVCEFLTGELAAAEKRLTMLASRAATTVERAAVECLRIDLYTTLDQTDSAVAACLDYLRHLGVKWSPHPTEEEARREYERIWSQLGSRAIEELIDLPLMSDPASLATLDVLTKVYQSALFTDANLLSMTVCRAVNLSLERGNGDGSCVAYVFFGKIAGPRFGDYKAGFRFGRLGYELVEKRGLERFQARTYLWFAQFVVPWMKHVRLCRGLMRRAFEAATKVGDLTVAVYSLDNLNTNFLAAGDPLIEAQCQAERGLEVAERTRFGHLIDIIATQLGLIRTLRGLTYKFGCFDDGQLSEALLEQHFATNPAAKQPECWYWIRKLQARFFAGDYPSALDAAARARLMLWTSAAMFETAEYHFYTALSHAASCASAVSDQDDPTSSCPAEYQQHFEALAAHQKQLQEWAENCPENFENRTALVSAEIARVEGRELDAERLYEQAIRSARANGFVHNEALANEVAARFYLARGFEKTAHAYLRDARYGYLRWGADGKVRELDELYPQLKGEAPVLGPTSTIGTPVEHLDLATVLKVSVYRDLKEREEALRRSEAYLSEAQRLSHTGSFGWDVSSGKIYWSQETFRVFAYDPATEPTLELVLQRTHPEDRRMVRELIDRVSNEKKGFDFEHRLLMPDGSLKYLRVVGHPSTKGESGRFEFVGAVTDITERKLAEKALQQKEISLHETQSELAHVSRVTTMGELAASIAHEINQPLGAIANNANAGLRLLATGSENLKEVEGALSDIVKGVDRATSIIARMRALVRKVPPEMARLHLHDVVSEVLSLIHHELTKRHVIIQCELAKDLPPVLGDRVQLEQVLLNLIMNGAEAMSEVAGGERKIWIRARRHQDNCRPAVLVSVQDSGVGLKHAKVGQLFEPFYTTKAHGIGMGLAISRSIVEAHGGRLRVATASGPGATFEFTLPANN